MELFRHMHDASVLDSAAYLLNATSKHNAESTMMPVAKMPAKSMKGFLNRYANPALHKQEKHAWAMNAQEKYGSI